MSWTFVADTGAMARWMFFDNHLHVLTALAEQPDLRLRDIANQVGITERATHRIVSELVDEGYLTRTRVGSRNRYEIKEDAPLRHPLNAQQTVGEVLELLSGDDAEGARPGAERADGALGSGELFRDVFVAAPAGLVVADEDGRFLAANPAYCRLLGYSQEELLGRTFRDIARPDDPAPSDEAAADVIAGRRPEYTREKRYVRRDGRVIWVKFHVTATANPRTGQRLFVAHVVDITQRKRREQAFEESEQRFSNVFDNAPIGLALVAPDGRWLKVNKAVCELTGYPETTLLVRTFQDITHPDDIDADLALLQDILAGRRRRYQMEKRYYHADGHVIWVLLSVSLVRDAAGEPLYFISQLEDITARKEREEELRRRVEQRALEAAGARVG